MIDSHCHLADDAFAADLEGVVARARACGVGGALCIISATSQTEIGRAGRIAAAWPTTRFATGVHPHEAGAFVGDPEAVVARVRGAVAAMPAVCAIGEIGLDYHYDFAPREVQREVFARQVELAGELGRPIVVHTREAEADTLDILRDAGAGAATGIMHCFTGDAAAAERALELGFHVSFSGIVTFARAASVRAAAAVVPGDRLLVETDAPYLAPVPHRGKRNEPAWVSLVVGALAEIRGESQQLVGDRAATVLARLVGAHAGGRAV